MDNSGRFNESNPQGQETRPTCFGLQLRLEVVSEVFVALVDRLDGGPVPSGPSIPLIT